MNVIEYLDELDYVLYFIHTGKFEFEEEDYPYIYGDVEEELLSFYENKYVYNEYLDEDITYIPTTHLPKEKQSKLLRMLERQHAMVVNR
tara:strand:+ start:463 stop:729 length:267 start_codon:yes stop_codon:yes gene_type:complete